jgi:hypothetical protein
VREADSRTGTKGGQLVPLTISTTEPPLQGALAELAAARAEVEVWKKRAVGWRAARKIAGWVGLRSRK